MAHLLTRRHRAAAWVLVSLALFGRFPDARAAAPPAVGYENGAVATDHPLASAAGVEVLRAGGNAVDAACAAAFALGVVNPAGSGIGGGGFMLIRPPPKEAREKASEVLVLDFRETAPAAAFREMFLKAGVPARASQRGGLAVATPGEVMGCAEAVRRHGRLSLARVLAPAIRLARGGFAVGVHLAHTARRKRAALAARPALARLFLPDGAPVRVGQRMRRPALARTLTAIAQKGPRAFYRGPIARSIARAVSEAGGILTAEDLARYSVTWRQPVSGTYRGYTVHSMPPPSSGGVALVEALHILEQARLRPLGQNASGALHLTAEALKHAFADRARHLGDPDFVQVPVKKLTSRAYAERLFGRITARTLPAPQDYGHGELASPPADPPGTSHISVIDGRGGAVALTTTINTAFGSMVLAGDTGILLNNQMDDFTARPGEPNAFGLIQGEKNAVAPGKRPLSSMTPTLVTQRGEVVLVAGASGGPTIISGTLQALLNVLDFSLSATEAVYRPRIHHQWLPDQLWLEAAYPRDVRRALIRRGHAIKRVKRPFTAVQVVVKKKGKLYPASDPRKAGEPAGY